MAYEYTLKSLAKDMQEAQELYNFIAEKGDLLAKLVDQKHNGHSRFRVVLSTGGSRIVIRNLDDRTDAIRILRELFGTWKDKLTVIWNSGEAIIVSWENPDNKMFEIWLETTYEEFPEELKGKNCHFEERKRIEHVLVCKS